MSGPFDSSPDRSTLDLDKAPTDTSALASTADESPRFQLSREMKILLGVLALGAAVAGWYVLSGAGTPAVNTVSTPPGTVQPSTAPATQAPTAQTTGQGTTSPGTGSPGTGVTPGVGVTPGTGTVGGTAPVTGGAGVLMDALRRLDEAGIAVSDVALRRPTLDDVFLTLTGRPSEEVEAAGDAKTGTKAGTKKGGAR